MKEFLKKIIKLERRYQFYIFTLFNGTVVLLFVKLFYNDLHYGVLFSYIFGVISSFFAVYVNSNKQKQ